MQAVRFGKGETGEGEKAFLAGRTAYKQRPGGWEARACAKREEKEKQLRWAVENEARE